MRKALIVGSLALLIVTAAAPAQGQGYLAPFIGYDFGGDAGNCPSILTDCSERKLSYGLAIGALAGGIFGIEEDISYAPDFFGKSEAFGDNSVLSLMTNLVVAIPAGPVRPYVSGGLGLMRTHVRLSLSGLGDERSENAWAYDIGGGIMFLLPYHLGFRGDYRYFKSLQDFSILGFAISSPKLSYSRVSVALVIH
jgi:opacity protein-like surface antigen